MKNVNWDILYQPKYELSANLIKKAVFFSEFANGGAQASLRLKDGREITEVLVSNSKYIIAIIGYETMPFDIGDVADIYQTSEDEMNGDRNKWSPWTE